jgi:excisionase family DNA binding protein
MTLDDRAVDDRLLPKKVVAALLACSVRTLEREVQDGHLKRVKVRGGVRFRESEVKRIIQGRSNDI